MNGHGANVLETIAATRNNGIGIDGINDHSAIWLGSFKGSANWAQTLVEFVDAAIASKQPNAVINLSFDLTQIFADGSVGNRYELTPIERAALTYAQQNQVLIVAAAGNQDGLLSALGKAAKEFNNILVVGAADGLNRANYSNYDYLVDYAHYGKGVDLLAQGTAANGAVGTSIAAAKVTGAASLVWAANPGLNYAQVLNILRYTATDVNTPGWDAETGVGLLNISAAVNLAAATQPQSYSSPNLDAIQTALQDQGIPKAAWTKFYQFAYYQELEAKLTGQSWSAVDAVASEREAGLLGKVVNVVVDNVVKPVFSVFTPAPTQWGDSKPSGGGGLLGSLIKDIKEISKVVDGENLAKAALALRQGDPINAFYEGLSLVDGVSELVDTFKYLKDGNAKKAVPSLITAAPKLAKLFSDL
ncbi:S8 family peptidase [Nostoc sp.]|uniref:S8 family peptidase n=1 Tax=Nostoc sp. TaxID=1180 RepID=UPI002FFAACC1